MKRSNLIIIIAGLLFLTPFLGVPNTFQDITVSILSLLIIAIIVFSKHLEGSIIRPRTNNEFDESLPKTEDFIDGKEEKYVDENVDFSDENYINKDESEEKQKF
jgi:hypothetical protein